MPDDLKWGLILALVSTLMMFSVMFTHHRPEALLAMMISIIAIGLIGHGLWTLWKVSRRG